MYQFISTKQVEPILNSTKIADIRLFTEYNEVIVYGILHKLFGEPRYETNDYENAYEYVIEAKDDSRGVTLYFTVYQGSSGCALGACERTMNMIQAVDEFMETIKATKPADYTYEGIYMDTFVKIKCGIQNGQVIYEESYLDEDE